jgi:hypothetical protein
MKKNKNIVWILLGILILLLLVLFVLNKEGMTNECKYQYLSPNQTNKALDDTTINDFLTKYDYHMDQIGAKIKLDRSIYDKWLGMKVFCSDEIEFYIKNNYFPLNSYVINELKTNKNIVLNAPFTPSTISYAYNARMVYYNFIVPAYVGKPNNADLVEAQQIYTGEKPEPSCSASSDSVPDVPPPPSSSSDSSVPPVPPPQA